MSIPLALSALARARRATRALLDSSDSDESDTQRYPISTIRGQPLHAEPASSFTPLKRTLFADNINGRQESVESQQSDGLRVMHAPGSASTPQFHDLGIDEVDEVDDDNDEYDDDGQFMAGQHTRSKPKDASFWSQSSGLVDHDVSDFSTPIKINTSTTSTNASLSLTPSQTTLPTTSLNQSNDQTTPPPSASKQFRWLQQQQTKLRQTNERQQIALQEAMQGEEQWRSVIRQMFRQVSEKMNSESSIESMPVTFSPSEVASVFSKLLDHVSSAARVEQLELQLSEQEQTFENKMDIVLQSERLTLAQLGKVQSLLTEKDAIVLKLQQEIDVLMVNSSTLENEKSELVYQCDELSSQTQVQDSQIQLQHQQLHQQRAEIERLCAEISERQISLNSVTASFAELQNDIDTIRQDRDDSRCAQDETLQLLRQTQEQLANECQLKEKADESLAAIQNGLSEQRQMFESTIAEMCERQHSEISALQTQLHDLHVRHDTAVEEVSQAHSASLQQQQQQFQVELDSLKTLLKETKARGEARLHRQALAFERDCEQLLEEHQQTLQAQQQQHQQVLQAQHDQFHQQINDLDLHHAQSLADAQQVLEQWKSEQQIKIDRLNADFEAKEQDLVGKYHQEIEELKQQHTAQLADSEKSVELRVESLCSVWTEQRESLLIEHGNRIRELEQQQLLQRQFLIEHHSTEASKLNAELLSVQANLEQQLSLSHQASSDISTLQASLAELREQHQELLRHHHVMTTESEQRLKELIEKDVILVQTTRELQQNREKVEIVTAILQKQKSEICSLQAACAPSPFTDQSTQTQLSSISHSLFAVTDIPLPMPEISQLVESTRDSILAQLEEKEQRICRLQTVVNQATAVIQNIHIHQDAENAGLRRSVKVMTNEIAAIRQQLISSEESELNWQSECNTWQQKHQQLIKQHKAQCDKLVVERDELIRDSEEKQQQQQLSLKASHRQELNKLRAWCSKQIETLKGEHETEIDSFKQSVTQCKSKERELRHAIDQSADKLKAVQQQHQFDQTRHEDERLKLQSEIDALRLQLQAAKSEISDSQTELADAQSELTRLQQQAQSQLQQQQKASRLIFDERRIERVENSEKIRKLEASLEQSQNETESLMKERENLQLKINQLEKSNHSLCAVFESQLSHLQAKFSGVTALMNQKQSEIQQQRQTIETLQTAQTQHSALATRLESENSDLHRQVQALKQSMEAMKDSHEDTVASLRELESEYDSLRAQSMDQDDVYQQLADKDHELQELHAQLQQAVAAKNSADGARSAQRREFESEMSALKSTMEQLKQRSAEMELKLQQSTNQSAASQQAAQDAVHATSRIKLELAQVRAELDECREQLSAERRRFANLLAMRSFKASADVVPSNV